MNSTGTNESDRVILYEQLKIVNRVWIHAIYYHITALYTMKILNILNNMLTELFNRKSKVPQSVEIS